MCASTGSCRVLKKVGEPVFYSTSKMCFSEYVHADTFIMSMILNQLPQVPDEESTIQLKNRLTAKAQNPFNAAELRAKIRKQEMETANAEARWETEPQLFEAIVG